MTVPFSATVPPSPGAAVAGTAGLWPSGLKSGEPSASYAPGAEGGTSSPHHGVPPHSEDLEPDAGGGTAGTGTRPR
jgi:hypothetical protein